MEQFNQPEAARELDDFTRRQLSKVRERAAEFAPAEAIQAMVLRARWMQETARFSYNDVCKQFLRSIELCGEYVYFFTLPHALSKTEALVPGPKVHSFIWVFTKTSRQRVMLLTTPSVTGCLQLLASLTMHHQCTSAQHPNCPELREVP